MFTLFKGINGSGKSTVFKALCYALYGKNKTLMYGESTSSVKLETKSWSVTRVSKPMSLLLTHKEKSYEDTKAQAIIENTIIGMSWEQFSLCAWVSSTSKASLATITPTERYNVIRTMVANTEETQEDCKKITEYEKNIREDFIKVKSQQATLEDLSKSFSNVKSPKIKKIPKNLMTKIHKLEMDIEEHEKKLSAFQGLSSKMSKKDIKQRIKDIELRPQIIDKIALMKSYLVYAKRIEKQNVDGDRFEEMKKEYFDSVEKDLNEKKKYLKKVDGDLLKAKIKEHTVRCIAKDNKNPFWDADIKTIKQKLKASQNSKVTAQMRETKQECPHCKKNVCIDGDTVSKYLKSYDKEKIVVSSDDVAFLEELQDLQYDYDENVDNEEEEFTKATLRVKECERILDKGVLTAELNRMNKSTGCEIEKPQGYKKKYNVEYLEERIEALVGQLGGIDEEKDDELERLHDLLKQDDLPTTDDIEEVQTTLTTLREKLRDLRKCEGAQLALEQWNNIQEKISSVDMNLEKCKEAQSSINKTMQALAVLKTKQREAEILSMQNVIQSLNTMASHYLELFFDEPISVNISMIKKTRNNTKMSLEISSQFRGHTRSDLSDFSQGETIKINLAFILALNQLNNSPFLLLDEIMGNIDKSVIVDVYGVLKELSQERPIFVIDHGAIEGMFDCVVEFGE